MKVSIVKLNLSNSDRPSPYLVGKFPLVHRQQKTIIYKEVVFYPYNRALR
jgi:hypothetical protein